MLELSGTKPISRMLLHRDESSNTSSRISSLPITAILYFGPEILIAIIINVLLSALTAVARFLPRPPRDLSNDKVVITGAGSGLGKALVEEFCKNGCVVTSISHAADLEEVVDADQANTGHLYDRIERVTTDGRCESSNHQRRFSYKCDSTNRQAVFDIATKIHGDIGNTNVLVICAEDSRQNILDVVTSSLMSYYWIMLAFIPSMITQRRAHIVAVWPATSSGDAYTRSKAAVAGIAEAIGQQFSTSNHLTFTTVGLDMETRLMNKRETACDIVQAVRRDQCSLTKGRGLSWLYYVGCRVYVFITSFTDWLYTQGCDNEPS